MLEKGKQIEYKLEEAHCSVSKMSFHGKVEKWKQEKLMYSI